MPRIKPTCHKRVQAKACRNGSRKPARRDTYRTRTTSLSRRSPVENRYGGCRVTSSAPAKLQPATTKRPTCNIARRSTEPPPGPRQPPGCQNFCEEQHGEPAVDGAQPFQIGPVAIHDGLPNRESALGTNGIGCECAQVVAARDATQVGIDDVPVWFERRTGGWLHPIDSNRRRSVGNFFPT